MNIVRLLLVTGLPGAGKSTLARELASHHHIALIAKDTIKEPLMDVLGAGGLRSRELSDASFAIMLAIAAELLASGVDLILEGNFRASEHTATVRAALPQRSVRIAQVLCRLDESERQAWVSARQSDPTRHPGHELTHQSARVPDCDEFLDLPGERLVFDGRGSDRAMSDLMASLDYFW